MFKRLVTDYEALLTFVVAGGGFAGVETIGSINDFFKAVPLVIVTLGSTSIPRFCRCSVAALAICFQFTTPVESWVDFRERHFPQPTARGRY
jgi:hypothetical protein